MQRDPRDVIAQSPMGTRQVLAVATTMALNAIDGFDVLSISFASPGISSEWGISRATLGVILSMELIGMAIGSIVLGRLTDRFGRRAIILLCLMIMATGMFMVTLASGVEALALWRVFTGFGIGGMLAATNAAVAEFANARSRSLCVSLMAIGYPLGAVAGGLVAARLLQSYDWRSVFLFGAMATLLLIPIVLLLLPETIAFLCVRQPRHALHRVNQLLLRLGHQSVADLPPPVVNSGTTVRPSIFTPGLRLTTALVTIAYFTHITTFYFVLKWVPKLVVDMGYSASSAAGVLVWANVGGATGGVVLGLLARRIPLRFLALAALLGSAFAVTWFGSGERDLAALSFMVAIVGFFTNGAVAGLYALFADVFPANVRATGTGFAIGVGRGGAALSPVIAGVLFEASFSLQFVATAMASGALIAFVAVASLPRRSGLHRDC